MAMTDPDLASIRDEVGDQPADTVVDEWFDELGHWLPVAIRILKRRRANAAAGGQEVSTFSMDGVLSVGLSKASLPGLEAQIYRLEAVWAKLNGPDETTGVISARIGRPDRYR